MREGKEGGRERGMVGGRGGESDTEIGTAASPWGFFPIPGEEGKKEYIVFISFQDQAGGLNSPTLQLIQVRNC